MNFYLLSNMHNLQYDTSPKLKIQPILQTARLVLRPFYFQDAKEIQRLAGHPDIAATTQHIPHPYYDGYAEAWIQSVHTSFRQGLQYMYAITLKSTDELIGSVGLSMHWEHESASMGYWMGRDYWGKGYCTEGAKIIIGLGFDILGLNRIQAKHLKRNPSSGKVLLKIGMHPEGVERQSTRVRGVLEDLVSYGMLKMDPRKDDTKYTYF
jgi:ribosomal-protein-alanine N-acetyltransferase